MKLENISEILKKEKSLLKDRDEILYSRYDLELQKKEYEEEIRNAQIKKSEYKEFKSEKLQELFEKIGCISVISLACYVSSKELNSTFVSLLLSSSFFTYFTGLSTCSFKIDLDEYKEDNNFYDSKKISQLEEGYEATKDNIEQINKELLYNSNSLTNIYNLIVNSSEDIDQENEKTLVKKIN